MFRAKACLSVLFVAGLAVPALASPGGALAGNEGPSAPPSPSPIKVQVPPVWEAQLLVPGSPCPDPKWCPPLRGWIAPSTDPSRPYLAYLNDAGLNGNPQARPLVTQVWTGAANAAPVAVAYDDLAGQWTAYNPDHSPLPADAVFSVFAGTEIGDAAVQAGGGGRASGLPLNDPGFAQQADAILIVARHATDLPHTSAVGVWYDGASWWAFNEDQSLLADGERFLYFDARGSGGRALHTTGNDYFGIGLYLDDARLNGNPQAKLVVQHAYRGALNASPLGVWYDEARGQWLVYNQTGTGLGFGEAIHYLAAP